MRHTLPQGYRLHRTQNTTLVYRGDRPDLLVLAEVKGVPGTPWHASGRAAIHTIEPDLVVRPLMHGGLLRGITGRRFLGASRSLREVKTSLHLASAGVPTPEVLAVRVVRHGLFVSIDVVTRLIPGSTDLLTYLEELRDDSREILRRTGRLIRRMHEAGVYHADLHVKNILMDSRAELYLLDLDNARRYARVPAFMRRMNLRRFARSVEKWKAKGRILVPDTWELSFRAGYEGI